MNLQMMIPDYWFCIIGCFTLLLVTNFIMSRQSQSFYTYDVMRKSFSIFDLEFPSSVTELTNLLSGITKLKNDEGAKVTRMLRGNLMVDFFFMPAIYGFIFLLCMLVSFKMVSIGQVFFAGLAWLQLLAWMFDIIENIYLLGKLNKINQPLVLNASNFKKYRKMVLAKWIIASFALVCAIAALLQYWILGNFEINSLRYIVFLLVEVLVFVFITHLFSTKKAQ